MADHVQQQILEGVKAALAAAAIVPANRVFLDRLDPLQSNELPAILVDEAPTGESVAPQTVNGLEQREFVVLVRCAVAHSADYARLARDLGAQVERVLGTPTFAVPKPGRARVQASRISLSGEGDRALAMREQAWGFNYFTRRGVPDVAH